MKTSQLKSNTLILIFRLLNSYTVVVLAYGASSDRELGIEGEHLLTSATDLINWYNGKIDYFKEFLDQKNFDFNKLKDISVIGNGNVATDLARIFLKDKKELENSDMPGPVIDIIKAPEINSVSLIGRRGVYQSAFSTKEIRELSKLDNLRIYMFDEDIKQSQNKGNLKIFFITNRINYWGSPWFVSKFKSNKPKNSVSCRYMISTWKRWSLSRSFAW